MTDNDPCYPCDEPVIDKVPPCPLQCGSEKCSSYKKRYFEGKPIVWMLGGPASGKGTQCEKIEAKYGLTYLSTTALLRAEVASQSVRGKCLSKVLERDESVAGDVILDLLKDAIFSQLEQALGFLIEGYPRKKTEAVAFEKRIAPCTVIFNLEASLDTLVKRHLSRDNSPVDHTDAIKRKLKTLLEKNDLVIAHYPDKTYTINAERGVEQVFQDITTILKPLVTKTV